LIFFPAKHFLFGSELTLWDSLYKGITGIKGVLFYCIHLKDQTSTDIKAETAAKRKSVQATDPAHAQVPTASSTEDSFKCNGPLHGDAITPSPDDNRAILQIMRRKIGIANNSNDSDFKPSRKAINRGDTIID
jgi:hypothetical protein